MNGNERRTQTLPVRITILPVRFAGLETLSLAIMLDEQVDQAFLFRTSMLGN